MRAHSFDGRHKPRDKKSGGFSQASTRRLLLAYDQHGRPYDGVIELRSGGSTGPLHPKFRAPFYPDPKFIIENPENPSELFVDYANWFKSRRQGEKEYHARAVRLSSKRGWPAPKQGQYSEMVLDELHDPPIPSLPVAACFQENPWMIGACKGCSTRDRRTGAFEPRFSHNCICQGGFTPYPPDPRLEPMVIKPEDALPDDDSVEDFSIDSYAELTGQSVEEVAQRPTQFRRVKPRLPLDGPAALADEGPTTAVETLAVGPEFTEAQERELDDAVGALESAADDVDIFADKGSGIDLEAEEEAADPAADGGRTVAVTAQERAPRQAPRQGNASTQRQIGAQRSAVGAKKRAGTRARPKEKRPTLADGAKPVISDN